ncbi:DUF6518 family protein [Nocardiopsis lambiniae]|uniref:DUF6518 family protein n=1 Tax=Nocardiopsis lambiniae TaxID=3075539 RepID=A0ABU2M6A1_9ACTN|nr:DUF6518 family protein [Nocardiopsis sp. DSM 44743]MDT0328150.1 DUF6518 family protein [Nocardiopsis sp. DSM 44743]
MHGLGESPQPPPSALRGFRHRHPWPLPLAAAVLGAMCGALSALYVFKPDEYPAASYGLFVVPAVLAGWAASRPGPASLAGMTALLGGVLGHFVGVRFIEYAQNDLEYRAWVVIALAFGALLGFMGHRLREGEPLRRATAASLVIGLLLAPVHLRYSVGTHATEHADPRIYVLDLCAAALVLLACRGLAHRALALAIAVPFTLLFSTLSVFSSVLLWRAGGGI